MDKTYESTRRKDGNQGDFGFAAAETKAARHRVPIYRVTLLRDGALVKEGPQTCDSPQSVASLVREFLGDVPEEHFVMLAVDSRNRVIGISELCCQSPSPRFGPSEVFA